MRLDGKTAFVTGAAQGIGLAIAQASRPRRARRPADVNGPDVAAAAAALARKGHGLALDVRDEAAVVTAIEATEGVFGPLNVEVAGAAVITPQRRSPILTLATGKWP